MRHDTFDLRYDMSASDIAWRIMFLLAVVAVLFMDVFFWRP